MPQSTIALTLTPESSQLHGYGYDSVTQRLAVVYRSNDTCTYEYLGVGPALVAALNAAESKGGYIGRFIKRHYEFERLNKDVVKEDAAEAQTRA